MVKKTVDCYEVKIRFLIRKDYASEDERNPVNDKHDLKKLVENELDNMELLKEEVRVEVYD
jgi:hypothetical protein